MRLLYLMMVLLICSPLGAEELYVRNQAFPGVVVGSGSEMYVEAAPLARALDGRLVEVNGGYLLYLSEESAGQDLCGPGKVVVEGMVIPSRTGPAGEVLVHLQRTAQALGCPLVANKELGTLDLYLAQTGSAARGEFTPDGASGWYRDVTGVQIPATCRSGESSAAPNSPSCGWRPGDGPWCLRGVPPLRICPSSCFPRAAWSLPT